MIVPDVLRIARRYIEDYDWIKLLDDWQEDGQSKTWYIHLSLYVDVNTPLFPSTSEWYFVVDKDFPNSEVKVFPSVRNSVQTTLYHQAKNSRISKNGLWRSGDICIRENTLESFFRMPYGTEELLIASILRTKQWLEAAALGKLVNCGDKFELPPFSPTCNINIAYKESRYSFHERMSSKSTAGIVQIKVHKIDDSLFMRPAIFLSSTGDYVFHMDWGNYFTKYNQPENTFLGIWVLLNNIPIIKDWQTPSTFKELFEVAKREQIDLRDEIKKVIEAQEIQFRDGTRHFLLIGFPVPEYFGKENAQIAWEAILLPSLTTMEGKIISGFRPNPIGRWETDKKLVLKPSTMLDWCNCSNWDSSAITQRGSLPSCITDKKILIIGAGCIGSMIAELLVREGVSHIAIIDDDILHLGNLTRHTLSLEDLDKYKAESLCEHLASINPNVNAKPITKKINNMNDGQILRRYDLIIDCTASSTVLNVFPLIEFDKKTYISSISMSLEAKHFFVGLKCGTHFEFEDYVKVLNSYTTNDDNIDPNLLPRDGIGCWHPAFPARMDDIISGVALSLKAIQNYIENDNRTSVTLVYGKNDDSYDSSYHLLEEH